MDLDSFLLNIYSESIFLILGMILTLWLVPNFTIKKIQKRNRKYLKLKISFAISELCDFLNRMPPEFKSNEDIQKIKSKNLKYKDLHDFVAILKPNLFATGGIEETLLKMLSFYRNSSDAVKSELMIEEMDRLITLRLSLENVIGVHSNSLEDSIINDISQLCLKIRIAENNTRFNLVHEDLTGEKTGSHGFLDVKDAYESAFSLLKDLVNQDGFELEAQD